MTAYPLTIKFPFAGKQDVLYPVLLKDDRNMILVDCGYEGFLPLIENAANEYGFSLEKLTGIIITHHDIDHMGGALEIKNKYPLAKVYASEIEKPYISGKKKSLRLVQAEDLYDCLPEEQKAAALRFQEFLKTVRPVSVDYCLSEDEFFLNTDIKIINTPGHMPGHSSIYLRKTKTLIAADAVVYENGVFDIANPKFTLDLPKAIQSIKKLAELEIETIICYHGGIVTENIREKLRTLITKYGGRG